MPLQAHPTRYLKSAHGTELLNFAGKEGKVADSMLDLLRDGVVIVDRNRQVKYVNASYYAQFGVTQKDIKPGDDVRDVMIRLVKNGTLGLTPQGSPEAFVDERMAQWRTEEGRLERRFLDTGRILDIYRSLTLDDDVIAVHVDVTSAVRSEQEVERQRMYMNSLVENMSDGVVLLDANGCFAMFNNQFLDLYDVDPADVHWGIPYGALIERMGDVARMSPEARAAEIKLRTDFAFDPMMTTAQRRLGDGRTLNVNKTNLPDGGSVMTIRDITEQLRREQELMAAQRQAEDSAKSKSEFVARMSHEMRTPLNGILGVAALLRKAGLNHQHSELVNIVSTSGKVLLRLIDDILDLSRIDADAFEVVAEKFRIEDVITECVGTIRPSAREKNLWLKQPDFPGDIPALQGDTVRIKQILLNLLNNAVKFTEAGGVEIGFDHVSGPEGVTLTLSVTDTGVGIAPDQLDQIFDRFYQIDGTVTRKYGGAGLGLAITRKLVDAMGGTIHVRSEVGEGTTFIIRLTLGVA